MAERYPPEPWHLGGAMHVSLWRVPEAELPASLGAALPVDARPLVVRGRAFVGTAFVRYDPGGVLSYDELLVATAVWHRGRPRVTISDIWVDSPASLAGGRALWGIPKQLASFSRRRGTRDEVDVTATVDGTELANLRSVPGLRLPGWRRLPLSTAQRLDGIERVSAVQSLVRVRLAASRWRFPDGSPLAWLGRHRPVLSVVFEPMSVSFGGAGATHRA